MTLRPRSNSVGARPLSAIPLSSSLLKLATEVWDKRAEIKDCYDIYDLYSGIDTPNPNLYARTQQITEFFSKLSFLGIETNTGPSMQEFTSIPFEQLVLARKQYVNYEIPISNSFVRMKIVAYTEFIGRSDVSPEHYLLFLMEAVGFFTFKNYDNSSLRMAKTKHRVYLNVKVSCHEEIISAIDIISYAVREIMGKINGISSVKITVSGRRDSMVIYTSSIAATNKALEKIQEYQNNNGVSGFGPEIPIMTEAQMYGVATASEPPQVIMIKGQLQPTESKESFGSLRADLIYNALQDSTGCSDFYELIVKYFRAAGIDASQPAVQVHYHSCLWKAQRSFIDQVITGASNLPS